MPKSLACNHERDCPDPDEIAGVHVACPCPHCMDTGFLCADADEIECDCAASLQTEEEAHAEIARLAPIGRLYNGRFHPHTKGIPVVPA